MKKKIALMVTSLVLVVAMAVGGTLAWLTDTTDQKVNTFTVGKVDIELAEPKWDETYGEDGAKVYPNADIVKDPTVTVIKGSEESYVRMLVTISNSDVMDTIFDPGALLTDIFTGYDASWVYFNNVEDEVAKTRTYEFRYKDTVSAETDNVVLPSLFTGINIPQNLTEDQLAQMETFTITVVAHAIQAADVGADADAAWAAFDGQNP